MRIWRRLELISSHHTSATIQAYRVGLTCYVTVELAPAIVMLLFERIQFDLCRGESLRKLEYFVLALFEIPESGQGPLWSAGPRDRSSISYMKAATLVGN
jgi:hypothetical protein